MKVEGASWERFGDFWSMVRVFAAEVKNWTLQPEAARMAQLVDISLKGGSVLTLIAVDDRDQSAGFALGVVEEYLWNPNKVGTLMALYVKPEKRGGRAAPLLVETFCNEAAAKGAKVVYFSHNSGIDHDRGIKFMERMNFERIGSEMHRIL